MKKMKLILLLFIVLTAFVGCSKDDDNNDYNNLLQEGIIKITTHMSDVEDLYIYTYHEGEAITIDWGDGRSSTYTTTCAEDDDWGTVYDAGEIKHDYSGENQHIISIKGNIKMLISDARYSYTFVDVSKCHAVEVLWFENGVDSLNVSGCSGLKELMCGYNGNGGKTLTTLDLSGCSALSYLNCEDNKLISLNVSDCTVLVELRCGYNKLTSLSLPKSNSFNYIDLRGNDLDDNALNAIYNSLPSVSYGEIGVYSNPGKGDYSIAEGKGWTEIGH